MKKITLLILVLVAFSGVGAFWFLQGKVFTVVIPEAELQQRMNDKLPITKSYLYVFEVTLSNPRVDLDDVADRFRAGLDVTLNVKIKGIDKPLGGSVDASGSIEYRPESASFHIAEPLVESFSVQGLPSQHEPRVEQVLTKALQEYYSRNPVYVLKADNLKKSAARLVCRMCRWIRKI